MSDRFPVSDPAAVSADAARSVHVPPFERVLERARANRRRRRATTVVSALTVAAFALGALATGTHRIADGPAAPQTPASPTQSHRTPHTGWPAQVALAERIATDPRSQLMQFAVSPLNPTVRAEVRGGALGLTGAPTQWALAVTTDGFRTTHYLPLGGPGPQIVPLTDDQSRFFVGPTSPHGPAWLVTPSGHRTRVTFSHATEPAGVGDVLVQCGDWQYCTFDPNTGTGTATAHWIPGPTPTRHADPGQLNGLFPLWQNGQVGCETHQCNTVFWGFNQVQDEPTTHPRVYWTRDGGTTWAVRPVPGALTGSTRFATPITDPGDLVLAYGTGHGPLYTPRASVHTRTLLRNRAGGARWQSVQVPTAADITDGAVLFDGRAVLVTSTGQLLRATNRNWHAWTRLPWPRPAGRTQQQLSLSLLPGPHGGAPRGTTLFSARYPNGSTGTGSVWVSTDDGNTWTQTAEPTPH